MIFDLVFIFMLVIFLLFCCFVSVSSLVMTQVFSFSTLVSIFIRIRLNL